MENMEESEKMNEVNDNLGRETGGISRNDPWVSQNDVSPVFPKIDNAPNDPLKTMISSESYVKALEKRLDKLKGRRDAVRPKDMIQSLHVARDLYVSQYMSSGCGTLELQYEDYTENNDSVMTSLQRRINPEKQALNPQELAPLLLNDVFSKTVEENSAEKGSGAEEQKESN